MDELTKGLQKFLARDLTFLVGGSGVLIAFLHIYGKLPLLPSTGPLVVLPVALAYVVGYVVQEIFTVCHVVRTKAEPMPPPFARWLYRTFERKLDWQPTPRDDYKAAKQWLYAEGTPQRLRDDHERVESLKQVGTTLGPCTLLAGVILATGWVSGRLGIQIPFEVAVPVLSLALGGILIALGWLKVTQQPEYLIAQYREHLHRQAETGPKAPGA